jgi:hypothetical protein
MVSLHELHLIASELRAVRNVSLRLPPMTGSTSLKTYSEAIRRLAEKNISRSTLLVFGELLWIAIRPAHYPANELIARELDMIWKMYDDSAPEEPSTPRIPSLSRRPL